MNNKVCDARIHIFLEPISLRTIHHRKRNTLQLLKSISIMEHWKITITTSSVDFLLFYVMFFIYAVVIVVTFFNSFFFLILYIHSRPFDFNFSVDFSLSLDAWSKITTWLGLFNCCSSTLFFRFLFFYLCAIGYLSWYEN